MFNRNQNKKRSGEHNETKKIKSDYIKKERLSKDVRYQEFNEITLGCMCKETSVKGYFFFYMEYIDGIFFILSKKHLIFILECNIIFQVR